MNKRRLKVSFENQKASYPIDIGYGGLAEIGEWSRKVLHEPKTKIGIVSNSTVFRLYGKKVQESLKTAGFETFVWVMKDGERYKSLRSAEKALKFLSENKFTRTDAIVALGGGVVGDLAGFVSAIYLRGIAFLQVPTTFLSMIDSSVGGKTGVNSAFGKNLIGSFYQPRGVLVDCLTLKTLADRELTAGFCEAVKHGAISGDNLLSQTAAFLDSFRPASKKAFFQDEQSLDLLCDLLHEQISFKASIVKQDEMEDPSRTDGRSRKILNFGHTLAHALEKVTDYRYFKHGEAVGYGILFAAEVSKMLALMDKTRVKLLNDVVHRAGVLPPLDNIDSRTVFEAFRFDKKFVSGSLQMVLLKDIGDPVIITSDQIPHTTFQKALTKLLQN